MLFIKAFRDYDGFLRLFGMESHSNGTKSRKNRILLNHLKTPSLLRWCREHNDYSLLGITDMATLKKLVLSYVRESGKEDPKLSENVTLIGNMYWSAMYRTDELNGLCEDLDKKSVRYVNIERNRVFKKKAGKFFTSLINETEIGKALSHTVTNWLSEEFCVDWETYTFGQTPEVQLVVDDDFETIYSPEYCKDFNGCSCMVGKDRHSFYEDAVTAKAASIRDSDGYVLARCIIFTDVMDQDGRTWRLAERQYAKESNEVLKRLLVDLLIKNGYIDGYKKIGAGCSENTAFVSNDGTSLSDHKFSIEMNLATYDVLSYQDSFVYYDIDDNIAYNYESSHYDYTLDTTNCSLNDDDDDDRPYDDYHERYCDDTTLCYVNGVEYYVDSDDMDDFCYIDELQEYHHEDDCKECEHCHSYVLNKDAKYSSITDEYYCCEECLKKAEDEFKKKNWFFCEYDNDWFEDSDKVMIINCWNPEEKRYQEKTIYEDTLDRLFENREIFYFDNTYFDKVDLNTNLPYGYYLERKYKHKYEAA